MQSFPNYWLGVMAAAFAIGLAIWIGLVFWADRHPHGYSHEPNQRGEVTGGSFTAAQGGRQVTPHPGETPEPVPGDAPEPFVPPAPRQSPEQVEPEPARTKPR
ncbi:MAG TPA: hypothetical protein VFI65_05890 [Streptosporangiaceae bacterium]|nr:hypothetical protein [Streptosporangiaceae bacterium]